MNAMLDVSQCYVALTPKSVQDKYMKADSLK